jgi:hypothetical protein
VGAATWASGFSETSGIVSAANSLVGSAMGDSIGEYVAALSNGNFVAGSDDWSDGKGLVAWANGSGPVSGVLNETSALVGTSTFDLVGQANNSFNIRTSFANGVYVIYSPSYANDLGAVTLAHGELTGEINPANSVIGTTEDGGNMLVFDYDAGRDQLVVGRPADNIVTLVNGDIIFDDGFEGP